MKKYKERLKEEISELYPSYDEVDYETVAKVQIIDEVLELINQLDEPGNMLVPKQDKPIIPQFVADYYKDYEHLELTFEEWFGREEFEAGSKTENKTFEWLLDNSHEVNIERQFILADIIAHGLDGYEVEKEKRYHVVNKENYFLLRKYDGLVDILNALTLMSRDKYGKDMRFMLTEKEIKDYDERFWVFAEEVVEDD